MLLAAIHLLEVTEMGLCRSLLIMHDNYVVDAKETLSSFPFCLKVFQEEKYKIPVSKLNQKF